MSAFCARHNDLLCHALLLALGLVGMYAYLQWGTR